MERLTERRNGVIIDGRAIREHASKLYWRLKHYEDLEEQGLLLRLPCKVGDDIWDNDFGIPCSYYVTGFSFGRLSPDEFEDDEPYDQIIVHYTGQGCDGRFPISELGKTVFLTKEEAENALAEMEKANENI